MLLFFPKKGGISIATGVAKGIFKGVARVATGKSEDTRIFEKLYANYICGNSPKAKEYLLGFAKRFGGQDEGLLDVAETIMGEFWLVEIAKANRGFVSSGTQQLPTTSAMSSVAENLKRGR